MKTHHASPLPASLGRCWAAIALLCAAHGAMAADTSIGNVPLFTSSAVNVKPNLMFILDDSGSMGWDFIPDEAGFSASRYGKQASQCNGVAYNPTVTYALPVDAAGNTVGAGSTGIFTPDPNVQLNNKDTLATPATLSLAASVGSSLSVTITGLGKNNSGRYAGGDTVTFFSKDSSTSYIVATVTSWSVTKNPSNYTGTLVATVSSTTGSGTLASRLRVAPGAPAVTAFYYTYKGIYKPLSYTYTSGGVDSSTNFYKECSSTVGATPGSAVFTRVNVLSTSSEAQNYANWYAYYRTRMDMARSSIGIVFKGLDSRYRVGYSTISEDTVTEGLNFVQIRDFDAAQKGKFFAALSAASPGSSTPLRGALSKAGRYYANKYPGQTYDPMQYACQKNFTILSTDGYWNTGDETSTYGPKGLDGNDVGRTDSFPALKPKYDGGRLTATKTTTWQKAQTTVKRSETTSTAYSSAVGQATGIYTPKTGSSAGSIIKTYTAPTTLNNTYSTNCTKGSGSASSANSSCVVTVTTSAPHGMTGTAKVLISGASGTNATLFNKSFTLASSPAANGSSYTIVISSITNSLVSGISGTSGNTITTPSTPGVSRVQGSCTGSSYLFPGTQVQTDNYTLQLVNRTTATVTTTKAYTNTLSVVGTYTYTQTESFVNGVSVSQSGINQSGPVTTTTGQANAVSDVSVVPNQSLPASSPYAGTPVALSTGPTAITPVCATTLPSPNPSTTAITSAQFVTTAPSYTPTPVGPTLPSTPDVTLNNVVVSTSALLDVPNSLGSNMSPATYVGGSANTLADVAYYYFNNDLRDEALWSNCTGSLGTSVCGSVDKFAKQSMTTLTLGLGVSGLLAYDKNYIAQVNAGSGDFYALRNGDKDWPVAGDGKSAENIDDLWHAAVNATDFGTAALPVANPSTQYFSAGNPAVLVESLTNALANVKAVVSSSSAAATSTLQPVTGDNDVFVAKFTSVKWLGDVQRFSIDPAQGTLSSTYSWSAAAELDARDLSSNPRKVYYAKSGQSALQNFTYASLTTDGLNTYFDGFCNKVGSGDNAAPMQCGLIAGSALTAANTGSNLVAYLLGTADNNYRARESRLGDVINGAPLFVGPPKFKYTENSYATFASSTRQTPCAAASVAGSGTVQGTIYVGANDGMLHAFDRCNGSEKWAYVPKMVMPNLYRIADNAYGTNHVFFVDGAPVSGDIYVNGAWKTILVGGLNGGGRGYYALDITDPAAPKALWEYSNNNNANLGLSFGNPIITKRASDGKWVVVFSSGYNNNTSNSASATGDGNGRLFMLDANTGAEILTVPTLVGTNNVGSTASPSGLSKLNAWIESEADNTAQRYYGGDLMGNVWRFDTENLVLPNQKALLLAKLSDGTTPQPITIQPELAQVTYQGANYATVYVSTGQYLGQPDLATVGKQSIYAFKDDLGGTSLEDLRNGNTLVAQTLTTNGSIRTATTNAVDWGTKNGWYVDLPTSGERVNINMVLAFDVLSVASTVPSANACESGGTSWLYKLDIASGSAISNATDNAAGLLLQQGTLIVGQTVVQLTDGSATTISTLSTGNLRSDTEPPPPPSGTGVRRTSWRELAN